MRVMRCSSLSREREISYLRYLDLEFGFWVIFSGSKKIFVVTMGNACVVAVVTPKSDPLTARLRPHILFDNMVHPAD